MDRPALTLTSITIGTSTPLQLAAFYAELLGVPVTAEETADDGETWAQIRQPADGPQSGPTLNFELERHHVRPTWPAGAGAQNATQHLDIAVQDLPAAVDWALGCGAHLAQHQPQANVRVMIDPDGHPFCLFTSQR